MRHRNRAAGFTFVEIIIAVLILTATVLVFAGVMTATSGQSRAGGAATQAPLLASHILETIKGEIKAGTLPDCGATTATHERSELTYAETRTVRALALDEATGAFVDVPCDAVTVNAYAVDVEVAWQADGVDHSDSYSETVSLAEHTVPRIDRFEANTTLVLTPEDANANQVTLSWDVPVGGQPLEVRLTSTSGHDVTDLPHQGDVTVNVTTSTVFTLTATNPAGSHTLELTVYANDLRLMAFFAIPQIVGPNEPVLLRWFPTRMPDPRFHTLRLQPLDIDVTSRWPSLHQIPTGIDATTTYTLEVFTNHESGMLIDSRETTVEYSATPVVHSLSHAPDAQCAPGGNVTIAWNMSAGHRVELDTGTGVPTLLYEGANGSRSASVAPPPPGTHTWTVIFTNRVGTTTTQSFDITTTALPVISQTFTPNPAVAGVEVMHAWNVDNATGVTLNGGAVPPTGSNAFRVVFGDNNTSYAIAAQNNGCTPNPNPHTSTLTVERIDLTNVVKTTEYSRPAPGEDITFSWDYTNTFDSAYHQVRVVDQAGNVYYVGNATSTTFPLPGAGNHSFSVLLETTETPPRLLGGIGYSATAVRELPVINSFTVPESVCGTSDITASWSTSYASNARINYGPNLQPVAGGSTTYTPPHGGGSRSYTLRVRAGDWMAYREVQEVRVVDVQRAPTINSFTISNDTPAAGETVVLSWNVSYASSVTLDGVAVSASGSTTRQVLDDTPFVLAAEPIGPCASADRATQTITPSTRMPSITSFAGTSPILVGQSSTLVASLADFDAAHQTATILAPIDKTYTTSSISEVVTPESSTTYTLRVATADGGHLLATANATVTVQVPTISVLTLASGYSNPALNGEPHGLRYELEHFDNSLYEFTITGSPGSTSPTAAAGTWVVPNSDTVSSAVAYTAEIRRRSSGAVLATRAYTIDVAATPTATFTRSPATVTANGTNVSLAWAHDANWSNTYHRSRLYLNGTFSGDIPASGTHSVAPTTTTAYHLRVWRRSDNAILQTYSFVHTTMPLPTVANINVSAGALCSTTETVTVSWSTSNASSVSFYNSHDGSTVSVPATGSRNITARSGGFVRITAANAVGSAQQTVSFSAATIPSINSFAIAGTTTPIVGESRQLSWNTSGASSVRLSGTNTGSTALSASGTRSHTFNSPIGTHTLTLTATSAQGCTVSTNRSVTVYNNNVGVRVLAPQLSAVESRLPSWTVSQSNRRHTVTTGTLTIYQVPSGRSSLQIVVGNPSASNAWLSGVSRIYGWANNGGSDVYTSNAGGGNTTVTLSSSGAWSGNYTWAARVAAGPSGGSFWTWAEANVTMRYRYVGTYVQVNIVSTNMQWSGAMATPGFTAFGISQNIRLVP